MILGWEENYNSENVKTKVKNISSSFSCFAGFTQHKHSRSNILVDNHTRCKQGVNKGETREFHFFLKKVLITNATQNVFDFRWYPKISNSKLSNPNLSMTIWSNCLYYRLPKRSNALNIEWAKRSNILKDRIWPKVVWLT